MNKIEIENRILFLAEQIPVKKLAIEKATKELKNICEEILKLQESIQNNNEQ